MSTSHLGAGPSPCLVYLCGIWYHAWYHPLLRELISSQTALCTVDAPLKTRWRLVDFHGSFARNWQTFCGPSNQWGDPWTRISPSSTDRTWILIFKYPLPWLKLENQQILKHHIPEPSSHHELVKLPRRAKACCCAGHHSGASHRILGVGKPGFCAQQKWQIFRPGLT